MKKKYIVELDEGEIEFAKNFFKEECEDFDVPIVSAIANATPYNDAEALAFKEEVIRMVNMGVYPEAIVEWVRESEAENE